jgi:teichoic acid transport system permease protein
MSVADISLAEYAADRGLSQSGARPRLAAYIREIWQRRNFIWSFASAKSTSVYTQSRLGQVWQVLTPLLNAAVYFLIFGVLLGTRRGVTNFIPFLITGLFIFTFTQRSVIAGAKSVGGNLSLIRALHFPRASLPFSFTIVELQQLLISLALLAVIVPVVGEGERPDAQWLLLIPVLAMQILFNVGLSLIVARIGAFVRDIQQLLPFVLRTWMYASGIIFSIPVLMTRFPDYPWLRTILEINPGSVYVELSRLALMPSYRFDYIKLNGGSWGHLWWYALGWALVVFVGGFLYFWWAEERYGRG